jgi:hypothetical protein
MKKISAALIAPLCLFASLGATQQYQILVDRDLSAYSGASVMISTYNFCKYLDDVYTPQPNPNDSLRWVIRAANAGVAYALNGYLMVTQHEVFGHGYRTREFGFHDVGYRIGYYTGATYFYTSDYNSLNIYKQNTLNAAGIEANTILAQQIRAPWFQTKRIDYRDSISYAINQLEQLRYTYVTSANDGNNGNDINNYINGVNRYYGNTTTLSNSKMRSIVLLNLLDPALVYSLYGIGKYLYNGSSTTQLYMLNVNGYKYLPTVATILAPWGPEFQSQNFVETPQQQLVQAHLRGSNNSNISSMGLDVIVSPVWKYKKLIVGNQLSIWRQPNVGASNAATAKLHCGIAEFVKLEYKVSSNVSLLTDLGYKTSGFMQGYLLNSGAIVRLGLQW